MPEPDTSDLPPVARARVERAARSGSWTSLLSAPALATLQDAGVDPVGEAMGCVVEHIGWGGWGCGVYTGPGASWGTVRADTVTSGRGGYAGYAPYANALYYGYENALRRCLVEARALGADGVVGLRWTQGQVDGVGNREFVALGTAVRVRSRTRPAHLFATDLSGQDVAKLMLSGWMPSGQVVGISVAIRHDDYYTRQQARAWSSANLEVTGYTELVTHVRADARQQFARRAARHGGDAAVVSAMSLDVWEVEPGDGHRDHVAQSIVTGTVIARFAPRRSTGRALSVLPVNAGQPRRPM